MGHLGIGAYRRREGNIGASANPGLNRQAAHQHAAAMRCPPVLAEVNTLPGAERQGAAFNRDLQTHTRDHAAHMRWRIVAAFEGVHMPGLAFGCYPRQERFEILLRRGIVILADAKRSAGVLQVEKAHAFVESPGGNQVSHFGGDVQQALATGGEGEIFFEPMHAVKVDLVIPINRKSRLGCPS